MRSKWSRIDFKSDRDEGMNFKKRSIVAVRSLKMKNRGTQITIDQIRVFPSRKRIKIKTI